MTFALPNLPYDFSALEPHISARTLEFHYGKHHKAYVDNLNKLTQETPLSEKPLEQVIRTTAKNPDQVGIFNNAAQVWNHTFYWDCMKPNGGGTPKGKVKDLLTQSFGSLEDFQKQFKEAALSQFGSGWAWLVYHKDQLEIMKTGNADLPLAHGRHAILTCDVWEHAYYLDYQNRRPDYVDTFLGALINWDFVAQNIAQAEAA